MLRSTPVLQGLISGTGPGIVSSAIPINMLTSICALMWQLSSPTSTPDVQFQYAGSIDGINRASFTDVSALLTSTFSFGSPQGLHFLPLSLNVMNAPFLFIGCGGTGSNPVDTTLLNCWLLTRISIN